MRNQIDSAQEVVLEIPFKCGIEFPGTIIHGGFFFFFCAEKGKLVTCLLAEHIPLHGSFRKTTPEVQKVVLTLDKTMLPTFKHISQFIHEAISVNTTASSARASSHGTVLCNASFISVSQFTLMYQNVNSMITLYQIVHKIVD